MHLSPEQREALKEIAISQIPGSGIPEAIETGGATGALILMSELPGPKNIKGIVKACKAISKASSPAWKSLKPWRGKTKTNGLSGKDRRYYEYDNTHNEIEVYNARGQYMGAMDASTGQMIKSAVPGRRIDIR